MLWSRADDEMGVRIGIDTGGTFTDLIALDDSTGELVLAKAPSTPSEPVDGMVNALRSSGIAPGATQFLILGTTVATNALLQRRGADVIFLTTEGFEDIPYIQRMNRRYHYSLEWTKPSPLVKHRDCIGVRERVTVDGEVRIPLDDEALEAAAREIDRRLAGRDRRRAAIAVCLLFSYIHPEHELRLGEFLKQRFPTLPVSLSHQVAPIWREYERGSTVIADAYIKPTLEGYLGSTRRRLHALGLTAPWAVMKSNGGNAVPEAAEAQPIQLLLSGLSGGVIGGAYFGQRAGAHDLITLDMGGTSCDVGVIRKGQIGYSTNFEIEWGLPVAVPVIDLTTIGAGGGSIAWIDKGGFLRVGPQSAGAEPGPACYRAGGSDATVTDANLVLGRINPDYFLGGKMRLDPKAAERAIRAVGDRLGMDVPRAAHAVIGVTNENMANAIRVLSIDRGLDPRDFVLVAFGGAGPLHASPLARRMGMARVVVPLHPGLCSAFGALIADLQVNKVQSKNFQSDTVAGAVVQAHFAQLIEEAVAELREEGFRGTAEIERTISMRYAGQNYEQDIRVDAASITDTVLHDVFAAFERRHEQFYGYSISGEVIELIRFNVTAVGRTAKPELPRLRPRELARPVARRPVYFPGTGFASTPIYRRQSLVPGQQVVGPAVIEEVDSTLVLYPGDALAVDAVGLVNVVLGT
jgi:N-methylhydantoinase A